MSKKGSAKKAEKKQPSCTLVQLQALGALQIVLNGAGGQFPIGLCQPRNFSSGSYGLGFSGPVQILLPGGGFADCQASINITVKHSKPDEVLAVEDKKDAA